MSAAAAHDPTPVGPPFADASPARIRAALTPDDAASFDRDWQELMARATATLDLAEVHDALDGWRQVAWATSTVGPDAYRRIMASAERRARTGERAPGSVPWSRLKAELGLPE